MNPFRHCEDGARPPEAISFSVRHCEPCFPGTDRQDGVGKNILLAMTE